MHITIKQAYELLKSGNRIAIPTDTVYGLAASLEHLPAIEQIFSLKGQSPKKPLIIQVATYADVLPFLSTLPPNFERLASIYWPGPLSLVVPVNTTLIPDIVRAGLRSAGFRIPNHPVTLELLRHTGPLVVSSANLSDQPPATTPQQISDYFGPDFPIIDGGSCLHGEPSTILEYKDEKWLMLREGILTAETILNAYLRSKLDL